MEAFDWLKQVGTVPSCFNLYKVAFLDFQISAIKKIPTVVETELNRLYVAHCRHQSETDHNSDNKCPPPSPMERPKSKKKLQGNLWRNFLKYFIKLRAVHACEIIWTFHKGCKICRTIYNIWAKKQKHTRLLRYFTNVLTK